MKGKTHFYQAKVESQPRIGGWSWEHQKLQSHIAAVFCRKPPCRQAQRGRSFSRKNCKLRRLLSSIPKSQRLVPLWAAHALHTPVALQCVATPPWLLGLGFDECSRGVATTRQPSKTPLRYKGRNSPHSRMSSSAQGLLQISKDLTRSINRTQAVQTQEMIFWSAGRREDNLSRCDFSSSRRAI